VRKSLPQFLTQIPIFGIRPSGRNRRFELIQSASPGLKPRPWLENNFVFPAKGKSAALDAVDSEVHLMNFGI
jgi:hypothetical protein